MLETVFSSIVKISLEGGVIGVLILLLRAVIRHRLPKAFFMCLWAVMFIRLAIPFEIPSPTSVYNINQVKAVVQACGSDFPTGIDGNHSHPCAFILGVRFHHVR